MGGERCGVEVYYAWTENIGHGLSVYKDSIVNMDWDRFSSLFLMTTTWLLVYWCGCERGSPGWVGGGGVLSKILNMRYM